MPFDRDNEITATPSQYDAVHVTRHYRKRGVPASGRDTARQLIERYALKREAIRQFVRHLHESGGKPAFSDTQELYDLGVTEAEVEALVDAFWAGEL